MVLRVGIVGLGKMGILHAAIVNALAGSSVVGICEKERVLAGAARKIMTDIPIYTNVEEMATKTKLDAVMVTTPIQTHVSTIRALLAGSKVAVFAEKPLALNASEAYEIAGVADKMSVVNMVGFQKRFSPIFQRAKYFLEKRVIGEIQVFRGQSYHSDILHQGSGWRFKKGAGGTLLDFGPHILDLLLWYFGEVKVISAVERSFYSKDVEDYVHAMLELDSEGFGSVDVSWSVRNYRLPEISIEIQGTEGTLKVTDDFMKIEVDRGVDGVIAAGKHNFQKPAFKTNVEFLLGDPEFTLEDKSFLESVEGRRSVQPDFKAAAKVNELINNIHAKALAERD